MTDTGPIDLIISAKWIVPVIPPETVFEDHALLIKGKRIVALCPQSSLVQHSQGTRHIRLDNHILIPGLVNAHGHSAMSLLRGAADDIPLKQWLETAIWPLEAKLVSPEFVADGAQLAIAEMIRSGTTCFADMYFFPNAVAQATLDAKIRVQLASPILDFPTIWAQDADEYISKANNLHDEFKNSDTIHTAFGPHAPYTVSDEPLRRISTFAEELDVPIHMHVHETAQEVDDAMRSEGKRPLQRLDELGLISPRFVGVHATQLNDEEIALLGEKGAHIIHCPESNQKLASGFCPVAKLASSGVNVGLGTDGCASNNDLDMFSEMRSAALLAKVVANDASALPAHQTLEMATLGGAKALGLDHSIGSLEPGKFADLAAIELSELNSLPLYKPTSHLVYSTQASQVSHVWCAGKAIMENRQLLTIDVAQLINKTRRWQKQINAQML